MLRKKKNTIPGVWKVRPSLEEIDTRITFYAIRAEQRRPLFADLGELAARLGDNYEVEVMEDEDNACVPTFGIRVHDDAASSCVLCMANWR